MKLVRWLLSNILLIIVVLALVYVYVYWDDLTGENTPAGKIITSLSDEYSEVRDFVAAIRAKDAGEEHQSSADDTGPDTAVKAEDIADTSADDVSSTTQPVEGHEDSADTSGVQSGTSEDRFVSPEIEQALNRVSEDGRVSGGETAAVIPGAATRPAPPAPAMPAPAAHEPVNSVTPPAPTPSSRPTPTAVAGIDSDTRKLWLDARRAFHNRDYKTCISNYEKLIAANKDNIDAYGELGNVYLSQGNREQAASAYFEAAAIMIRQGEVRRAASLSGLLHHLDVNKAQELKKLLDSTMHQNS